VIGGARGPTSAAESRAAIHEIGSREAAGQTLTVPHRRVDIHRYHAREPVGATFRWLSFERRHLEQLIAYGFDDTMRHDCRANGCILADEFGQPS
jgi:hypothetical protein